MDSIVEMVGGHMMPHPGAVLASVLAITFIGSRKLPKEWLKSTFRVRRRLVYEALLWLKDNNPLYGDIDISKERLMTLPEDGISDEVLASARHEPDGNLVSKDQESYIPSDEMDESEDKPVDADGRSDLSMKFHK
jgi:hypothetical protein